MIFERFFYFIVLLFFTFKSFSQIGINNSFPYNDPSFLTQNILVGGGVTISNISFYGDSSQIAFFNNGGSFGIVEGIIMSTGYALDADSNGVPFTFNTPPSGSGCNPLANPVCNDLLVLANQVPNLLGQSFSVNGLNDMCLLEFDFVPQSDTVSFNYSFGSEEYLQYINTEFNDVFGFFISGPGISGPYSSPVNFPNGAINIASIPNSSPSLPITVSSVHPNYNAQFYNTGNSFISYNGYTDMFTAKVAVIPCETYHITLAIADGTDDFLDSGVFLEANSFKSPSVEIKAQGIGIISDSLTIACNASVNLEAVVGPSYNVIWNTGDTSRVVNLGQGKYSFIASGVGSCVLFSDTIEIIEPPTATISYTKKDISCYGKSDGVINLSVSGGVQPFQYYWLDSISGYSSFSKDISSLNLGKYWCFVRDSSLCWPDPICVEIFEPDSIYVISNISDVSCFGYSDGSVNTSLFGGAGNLYINWFGNNPLNLSLGTYNFEVIDSNGCIYSDSININQPDSLIYNIYKNDISCKGEEDGSINYFIQSGGISPYSIIWSGPNQFVSTLFSLNNLSAGKYFVQLIDSNTCFYFDSVVINEPIDLNQSIKINTSNYSQKNIACKGDNSGWISIEILGGYPPYSFLWNNGKTTSTISNLFAGIYSVTVIDSIGCEIKYTIPLNEPDSLVSGYTFSTTNYNNFDVSCFNASDGALQTIAYGGVGGFQFFWNNGDISDSIFNLTSGYYEVIVYDDNGCMWMDSITISQPDSIRLILSSYSDTCERSVGSINTYVDGGVKPYRYFLNSNENINKFDNLPQGEYNIKIVDDNSCSTNKNISISNIKSPEIDFMINPLEKPFFEQLDKPFIFINNSNTHSQSIKKIIWNFPDKFIEDDSIVFYSFIDIGEYEVSLFLETEFSCLDSLSKNLVIRDYNLYIPNSFTPNLSDNINSTFKPIGYGINSYIMKIYSRWGELIFTTNDLNLGWNGTKSNGEIFPSGVYSYYIETINIYGKINKYFGYLNLFK